MKKNKNIFEILKNLTPEQTKIYIALDKLSSKNGYSYITPKSLAKKIGLDEQETYENIHKLIKNNSIYFIDLKEKETKKLLERRFYTNKFNFFKDSRNKDKLIPTMQVINDLKEKAKAEDMEKQAEAKERRFYTNKFNFFKDSRNKDKLIPTMQVINDLKEKAKAEDMEKQAEAKRKLEEIELNNLVDEYWENMDNIMYNELYIKAEEKYAKSVTGTNKLQNDFQIACFERLAPIYMKMLIKEKLALDMGKEIPDLFGATTPAKKTSEDKKIPDTFEEKLQQSWDDFEFYR